jgi:O-antigen ligase
VKSRSRPASQPALNAFRGDARASQRLHPLEISLIVVVGAHLSFLPWALGTMHVWSQLISLGLSALAFSLALISRTYDEEHAQEGRFKLIMWPKLIRFPLFWLGLALLAYILVQAFNPSSVYVRDGRVWSMQSIDYLGWLPSSMDTPFADMNAWRMLIIYASAWLTSCALWVGITRRSAVQNLFAIVIINGAVIALVGILQRATHSGAILWFIPSSTGTHFGTLLYKNHAGAFFNVLFMLSTAVMYWHFSRGERRLERSNPAPVFAFATVLLGIGVLLTFSRAATLLLIIFVLVAFISFIIRSALHRSEGRNPLVVGLLCAMFALFIGLGAAFLNVGTSVNRVQQLVKDQGKDNSVSSRLIATKATWELAQDNLVTGTGAGSFRFAFPYYQRNHPEIYRPSGKMLRWEYAHNDYVQLLAELGLIGAGLVFAMLAVGVRHLINNRIYQRPYLIFVALALIATLAHAWVDFQSHNPAILLLWCAVAVLLARWTELENRRT